MFKNQYTKLGYTKIWLGKNKQLYRFVCHNFEPDQKCGEFVVAGYYLPNQLTWNHYKTISKINRKPKSFIPYNMIIVIL